MRVCMAGGVGWGAVHLLTPWEDGGTASLKAGIPLPNYRSHFSGLPALEFSLTTPNF